MPGYNPASVYPFAVNAFVVTLQVWVVLKGYQFSYVSRAVPSFLAGAVIMIVLPVLGCLEPKTGFWACFLAMMIFGMFSGVVQASVFGAAGALPFKYMGAVMLGNGIAGLGTNIIRMLTLVIWPPSADPQNEYRSSLVFFCFSAAFLVICAVL